MMQPYGLTIHPTHAYFGLKGQDIFAQPNGLGGKNHSLSIFALKGQDKEYNDYIALTGRIEYNNPIPRALPWAKIFCTFGANCKCDRMNLRNNLAE